jgi:signal transduction histidine kinase
LDLGQISAHFWSAALPTIKVGAGAVGLMLAISGLALRWNAFLDLVGRITFRIFHHNQYDFRRIFLDCLERFNSIKDRRELYPAILDAVCRIVNASGASLLVRDSNDQFQIKASHGIRPFSFKLEEVRGFLGWMEERRGVVTRGDLVSNKKLSAVKGEGLSYFIQFNAEACVPLFINDRLYGVINIGARSKGFYGTQTRDVLKLMAVQFATSIHNANLYQALVRQNLELKETSCLKNQLLANMSHEFRTPLTSIIGMSELMAEGGDGPVNEEQIEHLSLIRQAGVRLYDTVSAMFDLSKLEADKFRLDVQKVNFGRLISQVAESVQLNDYTALDVKVDNTTPGVYGDEARLRQIMKHLLDNAAKFTKRGKIVVEAEKCGEMLKVKVRDTGIGIAEDKQKLVFEGFRQADGSTTREYEGLGLGLTISKRLVELHGGRMWLKSKMGRGSEFNFTLPLKPVIVFTDRKAS